MSIAQHLPGRERRDSGDGAEQVLVRIDVVNPQAGHGAGGLLPRIGPPPAGPHVETAIRRDVRLDLHHATQGAILDQRLQGAVCALPAPAVPHGQDHAGPSAGLGGASRICNRERERLLHEDVLPGLGCGDDVLRVERVRRREEHPFHLRIFQHNLIAVGLAASVLRGESGPLLGRTGGARHQGEIRASRNSIRQLAAPPPDPNCCHSHRLSHRASYAPSIGP